jgi:hypothetical protein
MKHFHEQLVDRHNYKLCYTVRRLSSVVIVSSNRRGGALRAPPRLARSSRDAAPLPRAQMPASPP